MKIYIAHCYYSGGRVIKFRTQAENDKSTDDLKPIANAIAFSFAKRMPEKVEFVACPVQGG